MLDNRVCEIPRHRSLATFIAAGFAVLLLCAGIASAQPIDMDLGIENDADFAHLKEAIRQSEIVRTDYALQPKPRVAATVTALMVFASQNPHASSDELTVFVTAYSNQLAAYAGNDPDLIRSNNYLAALQANESLEPTDPLINPDRANLPDLPGLDTHVGPRMHELLGISIEAAISALTLRQHMSDIENARVRSMVYAPEWSEMLIVGFFGHDLDGNPNSNITEVLSAYLESEAYDPTPTSSLPQHALVNTEIDTNMPADYASFISDLGDIGSDDASFDMHPFRQKIDNASSAISLHISDVYTDLVDLVDPMNGDDPTSFEQSVLNAQTGTFVEAIEAEYQSDLNDTNGARTTTAWATTLVRQSPNTAAQDYAKSASELARIKLETSDVTAKAKAGIELTTGLATLGVGIAAKDPGTIIGSVSASVLAGLDLADAFGVSNAPPSIEQQMFTQIVAIRTQIADLGMQLNERFDLVDDKLNEISNDMNIEFNKLEATLADINGDIDDLAAQIAETRSALGTLEDALWGFASSLTVAQFEFAIDNYLNARSSGTLFNYGNVNSGFVNATTFFQNFAVSVALSPVFAGLEGNTLTDVNQARVILNKPTYSTHVNDLRKFANTIPNVDLGSDHVVGASAWAQGASAYLKLMDENPWFYTYQYLSSAGQLDTDEIIVAGELLSQTMQDARDPDLFNYLFDGYQSALESVETSQELIVEAGQDTPFGAIDAFDRDTENREDLAFDIRFDLNSSGMTDFDLLFNGFQYVLPDGLDNIQMFRLGSTPEIVLAIMSLRAEQLGGQLSLSFNWGSNHVDGHLEYYFYLNTSAGIAEHPEFDRELMFATHNVDFGWRNETTGVITLWPGMYANDLNAQLTRLSVVWEHWQQSQVGGYFRDTQELNAAWRDTFEDRSGGDVMWRRNEITVETNFDDILDEMFDDVQREIWIDLRDNTNMADLSGLVRDWHKLLDAYTTLAAPQLIEENPVIQSGLRAPILIPGGVTDPESLGLQVDFEAQYTQNASAPASAAFVDIARLESNLAMFEIELLAGISGEQGSDHSGHGYLEWVLSEMRSLRDGATKLAVDDRYLVGQRFDVGDTYEVVDPEIGLLGNDAQQLRRFDPKTQENTYYAREIASYEPTVWDSAEMDGQAVGTVAVDSDGTFVFTPTVIGHNAFQGTGYFSYTLRGFIGEIDGSEQSILSEPATVALVFDPDRPTSIVVPSDCPTISLAIELIEDNANSIIMLEPGTYYEQINPMGKAFTLCSASGNYLDTIISGDLDQNGSGDSRVIVINSGEDRDTIIKYVTIKDGNSSGNGGGMIIDASSPTVRDCLFTLNAAPVGSGAGMFINNGAEPLIEGCDFIDNTSINGSGIFVDGSDPVITDCNFIDNTCTNGGAGALANYFGSTSTISGCSFTGNTTTGNGGGIANLTSAPTVTGCLFEDNTAPSGSGAGMYNLTGGDPVILDCVFRGNTAINGAAMINDLGSAPVITQSLFIDNHASGSGGAIWNYGGANTTATNCTFYANTAASVGGALRNFDTPNPFTLTNCVLWDNLPDQINNSSGATAVINYCNIEDGLSAGSSGTGNIDAEPIFTDADGADDTIGTADDDLSLASGSPCIDAADNSAPALVGVTLDHDGNPRFADDTGTPDTGVGPAPVVDMGAYEFQGTTACDGDANGDNAVDVNDLSFVLFRLGDSGAPGSVVGDANGDGAVDVNDISYVLFRLGDACP